MVRAAQIQMRMLLIKVSGSGKAGTPKPEMASNRRMTTIETIVTAVLTLPDLPAAMTFPLLAATIRIELTRNSRAIMMTTATEEASPSSIKAISAAKTSTLSATGSRNLPKSVIRFRLRAICPSRASVTEAAAKTISAQSP